MPDVIVTDHEGLILDPFGTIQKLNWGSVSDYVYYSISYRPAQSFPPDSGDPKFTVDFTLPDHPNGPITVNLITDDVPNPAFNTAPFVITDALAEGSLNALFGLPSGPSDPVLIQGFTVVPQDPFPPTPPFNPRIIAGIVIKITDEMRDSSDTFNAEVHYLGSNGPTEGTGFTTECGSVSYRGLSIGETVLYGVPGNDTGFFSQYNAPTEEGEFTMVITTNVETLEMTSNI